MIGAADVLRRSLRADPLGSTITVPTPGNADSEAFGDGATAQAQCVAVGFGAASGGGPGVGTRVAIGRLAQATGQTFNAVDYPAVAVGRGANSISVAVGSGNIFSIGATATGVGSVALGFAAKADGTDAISCGSTASNLGAGVPSILIGYLTSAGNNSIGIGHNTNQVQTNCVVVRNAGGITTSSVLVGPALLGTEAVAFGYVSVAAQGGSSVAVGRLAQPGQAAVAVGLSAVINASAPNIPGVAVGSNILSGDFSHTIHIGTQAQTATGPNQGRIGSAAVPVTDFAVVGTAVGAGIQFQADAAPPLNTTSLQAMADVGAGAVLTRWLIGADGTGPLGAGTRALYIP